MLNLALICALATTGGDSCSNSTPEPDVALPTPRERAATHLQRGLALVMSDRAEAADPLAMLETVADQAANELRGHRTERILRDAVMDARWREFAGSTDVWRDLAQTLEARRQDLLFSPYIEADLPTGFPAPTPVLEIELKTYPAYRLARTAISGTRGNGAFWQLFQHIQSNDIAMTAPVEMTYDADAPELEGLSMAFLYGDMAIGETGEDGRVEVVDIEPLQVLSMGCRGRTSEGRIQAARSELEAWLAANPDYVADGPLRAMGYNSPMVPDKRAYFEVQIPVRRIAQAAIAMNPSESRADS
jgi:SOUL heme-binding protein